MIANGNKKKYQDIQNTAINFSSANPTRKRSGLGHHRDFRKTHVVLQRSRAAAILCNPAQAEARESGIRRDIGHHDDVLPCPKSESVYRVRALRDRCERHWAWSPKCPGDRHNWRNKSVQITVISCLLFDISFPLATCRLTLRPS